MREFEPKVCGCVPSNPHALDLAHADVIVAPVIKTGGFGVRVPGHALGDLELAAVREVVGDAGSAEGMAADLRLNSRIRRAAPDHVPDIGAGQRLLR